MLSSAVQPKTSLAIVSLLSLSLSGCGDGRKPTAPDEPAPSPSLARIEIFPPSAAIDLGDTLELLVLPTDREGKRVFGVTITWSSSDETIATVDPGGLVTATGAGDATIRAAVDPVAGTAAVHVFTPVFEVNVSPDSTLLQFGESFQLTAAAWDSAGGRITDRAAVWSVLDTTIARVDSVGLLTAIDAGRVEVVARVGNAADTASVEIRALGAFVTLALSDYSTCALTAQGKAYCWGDNYYGELGIGSPGEKSQIPRPVAGNLTFRSIAGAFYSTYCALTGAGQAYCWGRYAPSMGAEAIATCGSGSTLCTPTPTPVAQRIRFESIIMSYSFACGITADAEAFCWGRNYGAVPQRVPGDIEWTMLAASSAAVCGLDRDGAAYCWGSTPQRVSGDLTFRTIHTTLSRVGWASCGITEQDTLYCWGADLVPEPVHPQFRFQTISVGRRHTCGIATDGTTLCWGENTWGQLGTGTFSPSDVPVPVAGGHSFITVVTVSGHSCGTDARGAFCWGRNLDGELGTYAGGPASASPVRVAGQE